MDALEFRFEGLHPDAPELPGDLDWLLRFVAARFEIRVRSHLLYDEIEFPVLELAHVLDGWVKKGMAERRDLDYEVTGGDSGTLTVRHDAAGWFVDSVHRAREAPLPAPLTGEEVRSAVDSFIAELERQASVEYDLDVRALLDRVCADASR